MEILPWPADRRWKFTLELALFLGLLFLFHSLWPVLVSFVLLERSLGFLADGLERRWGLKRSRGIGIALTFIILILGSALFWSIKKLLPFLIQARDEWRDYVEKITQNPIVVELRQLIGTDQVDMVEHFKQHGLSVLHYVSSTAHILMYFLIGLILAIISVYQREEMEQWSKGLESSSFGHTALRWLGHVADAVSITFQMQMVVALVNAFITLPVLLALGLNHVAMLSMLILICGLMPIVGNMISGAILCFVTYEEKGLWAVGVFFLLTMILHKIESYYLNPRLAAKHVNLPGLVLVFSLLFFEHIFGFAGIFLSFPALFFFTRIKNE